MEIPSSIIGHTHQVAQLREDIESDNLAQGYLFCGKTHLGKFAMAQWFAAEILTKDLAEGEKKEALHALKKNVHPDLLILDQLWMEDSCTDWDVIARSSNVPQQHRAKAKVKTNVIGIDDVRALQERLHETAHAGKLCCLIRSIERLHITAANAFLKILEEPPEHVLFCFTTESLSALPPTIVSRMRVMQFYPVPQKELSELLTDLSEEDRALLLNIAQGAPGVVLRALKDPDQLRLEKQAHIDALRFLDSPSLIDRTKQLTEAIEGDNAQSFLQHVLLHLSERLHSENEETAGRAGETLRHLFDLLHTLQSNTQKQLLASSTVLQLNH